MQKFKTIIVDDEPEARELLSFLLSDYPEIDIKGKAENVDEAIALLLKLKPDLVFLDIEMPNKSGFDFLNEIKDFEMNPTIIFVTAFNQYAIEAFKFAAFDYLLKPIESLELAKTLERLKSGTKEKVLSQQTNVLFSELSLKKVKFKTVNGFVLIDPQDIAYCIAEGNYCNIFLKSGEKIFVSSYLADVFSLLPFHDFFRISRSVVVNLKLLQRVNRKSKKCQIIVNDKKVHFLISKRAIMELEKNFGEG